MNPIKYIHRVQYKKREYKLIKMKVDKFADLICAPTILLPTYGHSIDHAFHHVEIDKNGLFNYIYFDDYIEQGRKTTNKLDDLLYWIFNFITFSIAVQYEKKNRNDAEMDCRRIIFAKQEELLGLINKSWIDKYQKEHKYVFDDLAGKRARYCVELREKGCYTESEISNLAFEKYPKIIMK
jgi:hypothetical protein